MLTTNRTSRVWASPCTYEVYESAFNIDQCLLPGDYTQCPALCAAWCGRLSMKLRHTVRRHQQIYLW